MNRPSGVTAAGEVRYAGDEADLDDQDLLCCALSHAAAADAYVAQDPWYSPPPVLSLVARAIELALKAYAAHKGATADTLRYQLSGDLEASLRYALDRGLTAPGGVIEEDRAVIRGLNGYQAEKRSGCPEVTSADLPCTAAARGLLDRLLRGCCVATWGEAAYLRKLAEGRPAGLSINARSIYRLNDAPERRSRRIVKNELAD
jgi:hypothetical protein